MISEIPESELPEAEAVEVAEPGESIEPLEAAGAVADSELPEDELAEEDEVVEAAEDSDADDSDEEESDEDESDEADVGDEDEVADAGADDFDNLRLVEALLFASAEPLAPAQIARFLPEEVKLEPLLADLQTLYANRGVNLVKRGGRWAFRTAEDLGPRMELENKVVRKLSRVALETLAVIAYHQPVTRAEIEEIRGVALSKGTLDALLEIGWIRPKGRRKTPGRPVTWGTSEAFLDHFGLEGLDALPGVEELKAAGLLDTRPALTALSDRGLLPAAGEVAPEEVEDEDDEDDSEIIEGSEQELLEATFGEDMLPQEVDLSAEPTGAETPEAEMADAEDADDDSDEDEDDLDEDDGAEASAEDAETDEDADVVDDAAEGDVAEDEDADAAEESDDEPQRSTG